MALVFTYMFHNSYFQYFLLRYEIIDLFLYSFISVLCFCKATRKNKAPPHLLTLIIFLDTNVSPTAIS